MTATVEAAKRDASHGVSMNTFILTVPQRRWANLCIALSLVLLGLFLTVVATESRIGAHAGTGTIVGIDGVVRALREDGLDVAQISQPAEHPLLDVAGRALQVNGATVEVYVYPSVARRVADEQRWNERVMGLTTMLEATDGAPARIASVNNVLLLFASDDPALLVKITHAIGSLSA